MIHRFVPGSTARTLLLLHGTGGNEEDLLPLGKAIDPAAGLLSPRGEVLEAGMPRFFRRLAPGVFDLEDLHARTLALASFISESSARYGFDASTVVAVGYSNGANVAASLLYVSPSSLAGAALLHAMVPFPDRAPPALGGVPVLITGGRRDVMVPAHETQLLAETLERWGARVKTYLHEGGHELVPEEIVVLKAWLAEQVGDHAGTTTDAR